MPLSSQKFQKSLPVNMNPRSVMMLLGRPKRWIISSSSSAAFFIVLETKGLYSINVNPAETSRSRLERPDHIRSPACKRTGRWNGLKFMGWNVSLLGEKLAPLTVMNQLLG
jgi:hypothetical protein